MTEEECIKANGSMVLQNAGKYACEITKDTKRTKEVIEWEKNHKKYQEIEESIINPDIESSSSTCPDGWYYFDYYGKCAKDLEHVTYEECESKGGMFAGYDSCTILE